MPVTKPVRDETPYIEDIETERTDIGDRIRMRRYYKQNRQDLRKKMRLVHEISTCRTEGGASRERRHTYLPDGRGRRTEKKRADLNKVVERITDEIRNKDLAQRLIEKVTQFTQTHDKRFDLTNEESARIYRHVDFGNHLKLQDRQLNIKWKDHAQYRSDLRNIKPKDVNEQIKKEMMKHLEEHKTKGDERLKTPNNETIVVDYSLDRDPAKAEVVTVFASELIKIARLLWVQKKS
jgi:hypothetical protein